MARWVVKQMVEQLVLMELVREMSVVKNGCNDVIQRTKNVVIMNTWFKEHPRRLYTWKSPGDYSRNQIDYIAINSQFKRGLKGIKTYPGADYGSNHVPVVAKFQCKLKKVKKARNVQKLVLSSFICQKFI